MERFRLSTAVYFPKRRVSPRAHTAARGISQGLSGCKVTGSSIDACGSLMKRRWPFRLEPFPLPLPPTPACASLRLRYLPPAFGWGTDPARACLSPAFGWGTDPARACLSSNLRLGGGGPIRGCPVQLVTVRRYG